MAKIPWIELGKPLRRKGRKAFSVGFVQILEEGPQLNTLRCHGHEFHGAPHGGIFDRPRIRTHQALTGGKTII